MKKNTDHNIAVVEPRCSTISSPAEGGGSFVDVGLSNTGGKRTRYRNVGRSSSSDVRVANTGNRGGKLTDVRHTSQSSSGRLRAAGRLLPTDDEVRRRTGTTVDDGSGDVIVDDPPIGCSAARAGLRTTHQ